MHLYLRKVWTYLSKVKCHNDVRVKLRACNGLDSEVIMAFHFTQVWSYFTQVWRQVQISYYLTFSVWTKKSSDKKLICSWKTLQFLIHFFFIFIKLTSNHISQLSNWVHFAYICWYFIHNPNGMSEIFHCGFVSVKEEKRNEKFCLKYYLIHQL